jgi:carbonic anhydrase
VNRIRPSVEGLLGTGLEDDAAALAHAAERANVRQSVDHLRHGSRVLEELTQNDGLLVVGAQYSLETGLVDFFFGA